MTCARQRQVFGCDRSGLVPRTVGGMRQRAGFAGAPVSDPASDETALIWVNVSLARLRQSKDMLNPGARLAIGPEVLDRIIVALAGRGYRVIGPVVRDGAIVYDTLTRLDELPAGWTDRQDGGRYRLERRGDMAYSAMPSGRIPGNASCTRRSSGSGRRAVTATGSRPSNTTRPRSGSPSSGSAPANSGRSRSKTGCSLAANIGIEPTGSGASKHSSSRSIAARPAAPAFARRWEPDPRPGPGSTSP